MIAGIRILHVTSGKYSQRADERVKSCKLIVLRMGNYP